MITKTENRKPCPFCGSADISRVMMPGVTWVVGCTNCGVRTAEYSRSADALNAWNRRPEVSEQQPLSDELGTDEEDGIRSAAEIISEMGNVSGGVPF